MLGLTKLKGMSVKMKLKYYLRGVGAGILFATVILTISYRTNAVTQLSDDEIIKRAEKLGMVKKSEIDMDDIIAPTQTPTVTPTSVPTQEPADTSRAEQDKGLDTSPGDSTTGEGSDTREKDTEEASEVSPAPTKPVETSDVTASDNTLSSDNETDNKPVTIEIMSGMTSEDVAKLLKKNGIIEDAVEFNQYLKQKDYTTRIQVGKFQFDKNATFQDIVDAIVQK